MQIVCATVLVLSPFLILFFIYNSWQRIQKTGSLVMREEYRQDAQGNVLGPGWVLDVQRRVLVMKNGEELPFETMRGIFIEALPARRVGVGLFKARDEEILLSTITNNDLRVAAQDAGLIVTTVANQAEQFQQAVKSHPWTHSQVGTRFEYRF